MEIREALIEKLEEAALLASQYSGGYSDNFYSAEEFYAGLKENTEKLKKGDNSVLNRITVWFVPSYDWDDFVGDVDLGNEVFKLLREYKEVIDSTKEPKRDKKEEVKSENETKIEPVDKKEALKAINAFIRLKEYEAAIQIAKLVDFTEDEIAKIRKLIPNFDKE